MRYFVLIALLCSCRRQPPPAPLLEAAAESSVEGEEAVPPELWSWSWSSVTVGTGALAQVRQTASARGRCRVSASVGSKPVWSVDACIAKREQLRFASPDALALVVLNPLPDFDDDTLGAVYRKGARVLALTPTSLQLSASATYVEGNKFHWLSVRDQRETPEGVEVELLDGSVRTIRFDGGPIAVPASAKADAARECSPCSYTDGEGLYHLVESAAEIPARYRSQAGRIRGSIQRADAVVVTYRPPPFSEPSEPVRRAAPATGPAPSTEPPVSRNELGEDFIQYTTRLRTQALFPTTDPNAKCIDNGGAQVPCSQIGIRVVR